MTPNERKAAWKRVQELYHAARELQPEDRAGFLAYQCAEDGEIRARIERLLAVTEDGTFLAEIFDEADS